MPDETGWTPEKQTFLIDLKGQYPTVVWIARILAALENHDAITIVNPAKSEYPGHFAAHFGNKLRDGSI